MALLAVAIGFSSCKEDKDKDPVVKQPTSFVLNTPALASQYYELTEDGTVDFTVFTQADYGFVASATYGLQIALTEDQKATPYDLVPLQPNSTHLSVKASDFAMGMCNLLGIATEDDWNDPEAMPVYVRATSQLGTHENTLVYSNWITLSQVKTYFAVPVPGYIYLVGSPEGWAGPDAAHAAHYADWRLYEKSDEIGSKVYYGTFDMPAAPMFRFYTDLTGWDGGDSWGAQEPDNAVDVEIGADGIGTYDLVHGKGAFNFPGFGGGTMTVVVDMNTKKVSVLTEE